MIRLYKTRNSYLIRAELTDEISQRLYTAMVRFFDHLFKSFAVAPDRAVKPISYERFPDINATYLKEYRPYPTLERLRGVAEYHIPNCVNLVDYAGMYDEGWSIDKEGRVVCDFTKEIIREKNTIAELFEGSKIETPAIITGLMMIDDIYYGSTPAELLKNVEEKGGKLGDYVLPASIVSCSGGAIKSMLCLISLKNGLVVSGTAKLGEYDFPDDPSFKNLAFADAFENIIQSEFVLNYQQTAA